MTDNIREILPNYSEWPAERLSVLDTRAPERLWLRGEGDLKLLIATSVAVIGSRSCTMYGEQVALDMASSFGEHGYTVVSGGAFGIDVTAHRGAFAARKPTIAILACGADRIYPAAHENIFEQIVRDGGLIVSEQPPGTAPTRDAFLARNRLTVALTQATVVVEAATRSGAMATARWATSLQRPLFAVPGPITSALSWGPNDLLASRDARVATSSADVIDYLKEDDNG